jgi:sarcosine oxidase subunit alpha
MKIVQSDVTVIGGGPAGMAAALYASKAGARVALIDRNRYLGGILNQCIHDGFGLFRFGKLMTGPEYAELFVDEIKADAGIETILDTMVTDVSSSKRVTCVSRNGVQRVESGAVVFATGCRERTRGAIALPGTRPSGIYTAGTAQYLMNICNISVGRKAVILGSGDVGLIMARRLMLSGVEVVCVLEKEAKYGGLPRNVYQCLEDYRIPLYLRRTIIEIRGRKRLESVMAADVDDTGTPISGSEREIPCDTLILSVGLIPENELASKAGVDLIPETNGMKVNERLETNVAGMFGCGNALHVNDLVDKVSDEGECAGKWAAAHTSFVKGM